MQGENGMTSGLNMSGEMHMWKRDEVFGCIPHVRGAQSQKSTHLDNARKFSSEFTVADPIVSHFRGQEKTNKINSIRSL